PKRVRVARLVSHISSLLFSSRSAPRLLPCVLCVLCGAFFFPSELSPAAPTSSPLFSSLPCALLLLSSAVSHGRLVAFPETWHPAVGSHRSRLLDPHGIHEVNHAGIRKPSLVPGPIHLVAVDGVLRDRAHGRSSSRSGVWSSRSGEPW